MDPEPGHDTVVQNEHEPAVRGQRKRQRVVKGSLKRARTACTSCRRVKEKCEGGQPCDRCTRLERECEIVGAARPILSNNHGFDSTSSVSNEYLDPERIYFMEQIIRHYTGTSTCDKTNLKRVLDSLDQDPPMDNHVSAQDNHAMDGENATEGDEDEDGNFTISAVSPTTTFYSGELSHTNFSIRVQQQIGRTSRHATSERFRNATRGDPALSLQLIRQPHLISDAVRLFPPEEVAHFLIGVFVEHARTNYFYIDERHLRDELRKFYSASMTSSILDASWVCTTLMVFAIGTQFAHMTSKEKGPSLTPDQPDTFTDDKVALNFYQAASRLIPDVITAASVESVQAFTLLGVYTLPVQACGLSCTYLGIAIRIATQNGMHRNHRRDLDVLQIELRKRLWWTAYTLERRICVLHGRPVSIAQSEVDVDLPVSCPSLQVSSRSGNLSNFLAMIRLTTILDKARETLLTFKRSPKRLRPARASAILHVKEELQGLWHTLPEKGCDRDLSPASPLFRSNIHLALTYHLIHVFIGRSFIMEKNNTCSASPLASASESESFGWSETRDSLIQGSLQSGLEIVTLCQFLHDEVGLARTSYTEYTSCCAAVVAILAYRVSSHSPDLQSACQKGIDLLKHMAVGLYTENSEKLAVEVLEAAVRRLDNHGGKEIEIAVASRPQVAYQQFREWAERGQMQKENNGDPLSMQAMEEAQPSSLNYNTVRCPDHQSPQNSAETINPDLSFDLDNFISMPGLEQWFEFGLH